MFTINLFTINKRDNSTKRPSDNGASFSCNIKSESSIISPLVELDKNPIGYNYAYIGAFNRYYFITDITYSSGIWLLSLKCDVLATYKDVIGSTSLYVLRASASYDGNIIETMYPTKTNTVVNRTTFSKPFNALPPNGSFMCGIVRGGDTIDISSQNSQYGSVSYCYITTLGLATLSQALLSSTTLADIAQLNIDDASFDLQKSLIDPLSYIKSCVWLPISGTYTRGSISVNGWTVSGVSNGPMGATPYATNSVTIDIPKHPNTNDRGNYVNTDKFTKLWLDVPPYGTIELDTSITCNQSTITLEERIDKINGRGTLRVICGDVVLNQLSAQVGVNIQLSQVVQDLIGASQNVVNGTAGVIGNLISGNVAGAITQGFNSIGDASKNMAPKASSSGSNGGFSALSYTWSISSEFFIPVDEDNAHNGRPLCAMRTPASLGGYMLIQDGDVSINGTANEDSEIRTYLESGFYYE